MAFSVPFLAYGPKVTVERDVIRANTTWLVRTLSLFSYGRWVAIDSRTRSIRIRRQYLWFVLLSETVPFTAIASVNYDYFEFGSSAAYVSGERAGSEIFDVCVRLHDGSQKFLVRFSGNGEYVADHSFAHEFVEDWIREQTDVTGTQQEDSLRFVELLCGRIGVPMGA